VIDAERGTLELGIPDQELADRQARLPPREPRATCVKGRSTLRLQRNGSFLGCMVGHKHKETPALTDVVAIYH